MNYRQWVVDAIPCRRPHAGGQYSVLSTRFSRICWESECWQLGADHSSTMPRISIEPWRRKL